MPIKKLSYGHVEVDDRLGLAHFHNNLDLLDSITQSTLDTIANSADIELSNVPKEVIEKVVKEAGVAFIDALSDGRSYVRKNESWVDIATLTEIITTITVDNLMTVTQAGNSFSIGLADQTKKILSSVKDKANKAASGNADMILVATSDGNYMASGKKISDMLLATSLITDISKAKDETRIPVAGNVVYNLYEEINKLKHGAASSRGTVCNVRSTGSGVSLGIGVAKAIHATGPILITSKGIGYSVGDVLRFSNSTTIIPALGYVSKVDSGGIISEITIISGGYYTSFNFNENVAIEGGSGSGAIWKSNSNLPVAYSDLSDIINPVVGDSCYVMMDETHQNSQSLYTYDVVTIDGEENEQWLWVMSFLSPSQVTSRYITRYSKIE